MIRRIPSLLPLLLLVFLPATGDLGAQQGERTFTPFSERTSERGDLSAQEEVFLGALEAIRDFALVAEPDSALWEKAIKGLIQELGDPYAEVLTPEQVRAFQEESTGNYAGIGVQITELNERVTITAVFRDTPAYQEGLLVGDQIVGVDGEDTRDWTVSEASDQIRGEIGTEVVVTVQREGIAQPIPHTIRRDQVHIPAVTSERVFGGLGYIHLDRVARESAAEVDSVLAELDDAPGLILDLRGNPGGYLDESLNLADLFLDRGSTLVTTRSRPPAGTGNLREESAYARRAARAQDKPLIVLVDRFSASASEIVAGALQDHDRALVLGERTFGKGSVQTVIPLPADHMIRLTSGEWYTPLGRSLNRPRNQDGRVIEPDSIPRFTSEAGRTIWGGGGVYPDLVVPNDTLTTSEQQFLTAAVEAEISMAQRVQEAAFNVAQEVRDSGEVPDRFPQDRLDAFLDDLAADGISRDLLNSEVRDYLDWRLEVVLFQRLDRTDRALQARARRDSTLARAVELLGQAATPAELFSLVPEAERPSPADQVEADEETDPQLPRER